MNFKQLVVLWYVAIALCVCLFAIYGFQVKVMPLVPVILIAGVTAYASMHFDPPLRKSLFYLLPAVAVFLLFLIGHQIKGLIDRSGELRREEEQRVEQRGEEEKRRAEEEKMRRAEAKRLEEEREKNRPRELPDNVFEKVLVKGITCPLQHFSGDVLISLWNASDWTLLKVEVRVTDGNLTQHYTHSLHGNGKKGLSKWQRLEDRGISPKSRGSSQFYLMGVQDLDTGDITNWDKESAVIEIVKIIGVPPN